MSRADKGEHADEEGGEAGFTLVELLVAMALLALLALLSAQGIAALRSMAPVAARLAGADEVAAVRGHLRATLGEALTSLPLGEPIGFSGTAERLRFVAPADPILEAGGLAEIGLSAEPGAGGGLDLVERRAVARAGPGGGGAGTPVVLLSNIAALRISYAEGAAGEVGDGDVEDGQVGDGGAPWSAAWTGPPGRLPALVRVEVDLPQGDPRRFPPLLVHPRASPAPPAR